MKELWIVQRLKDGTYGDWRVFKENKKGVIITGDKVYKYVYGRNAENQGSIIEKAVNKMTKDRANYEGEEELISIGDLMKLAKENRLFLHKIERRISELEQNRGYLTEEELAREKVGGTD